MTALFAAVGLANPLDASVVRAALRSAGNRAGQAVEVRVTEDFAFGLTTQLGAPADKIRRTSLVIDQRCVGAADATLYHVRDLRDRLAALRPRHPRASTFGELIRDAFLADGDRCAAWLEGDFAFVLWDRWKHRLFCARDFAGRRPLYYCEYRGGIVIASALASFGALPGFDARPELATVGADAAGMFFVVGDETCLRGVRALGAGCRGSWSAGRPMQVERVWHPAFQTSDVPFARAALQLRELLCDATRERIDDAGPTAVWLSGGRDSSAVFGSGMSALESPARRSQLVPISRDHPVGDPERENEAVEAIAAHWHASVSWVDVKRVPLLRDGTAGQLPADSFEQPFHQLTHALAAATRDNGARVALDGHGGDFLFSVSRAYLQDLVARGEPGRAWREWRAIDRGREGVAGFVRTSVLPTVSPLLRRAAGVLLRRQFAGAMERMSPPWISRQFLAAHDIEGRRRALGPDAMPGDSAFQREARFFLTHPFFARVNAAIAGHAVAHEVELRSPLLDRRVVEFALSRPSDEPNLAGDQKRLLRAAMDGLLPASALAPRLGKHGTLAPYFAYHMTTAGLQSLRKLLPRMALAEHGVIDTRAFSGALDEFARQGAAYPHMETLFCTLQAERWLRANDGASREAAESPPLAMAVVAT